LKTQQPRLFHRQMSGKKKPKKEVGWQVFRMRGAGMTSLGIVYAQDEAGAVEKAAEQYSVPDAARNRLVARPWLSD
jgi:hypothetical protein